MCEVQQCLETCGFSPSMVELTELFKRERVPERAINYYIDNQQLFEAMRSVSVAPMAVVGGPTHHGSERHVNVIPATTKCVICLDDKVKVDEMFTMDCKDSHRFCFECVGGNISKQVLGDRESQGHIPACPNANGPNGCSHLMTENEV